MSPAVMYNVTKSERLAAEAYFTINFQESKGFFMHITVRLIHQVFSSKCNVHVLYLLTEFTKNELLACT